MRQQAAVWEDDYQADRRGHHHRCRCCTRVLKDGERALMVRVGWKKTYAIHASCSHKQHSIATWTWRDAFTHWGAEYQQGKALPMSAMVNNKEQASA